MIRPRTWRGIVLLGMLAAVSWQLAHRPSEDANRPPERPDTRLNYALFDFSARLLDKQGAVQIDLSAPELRNDANSGIGTVEAPEISIHEQHERWYITAESAVISADRETAELTGAVHMSRLNELTDQILEISTSEMVLKVTPRIALTDSAVRIRQRGDWLDAVGMKLDMINERYELLHDVRAHFRTD